MARVKRAVHSKKHRRAVLEQAQGYFGNKSRSYRAAHEQVMHSLQYAYRDRRARKGDFRQLWIQRINAGRPPARHELQPAHRRSAAAGVEVDRKILADLAVPRRGGLRPLSRRPDRAADRRAPPQRSRRPAERPGPERRRAPPLNALAYKNDAVQRLRRLSERRGARQAEGASSWKAPSCSPRRSAWTRRSTPCSSTRAPGSAELRAGSRPAGAPAPGCGEVAAGVLGRVCDAVTPQPCRHRAGRRRSPATSSIRPRAGPGRGLRRRFHDPGNLGADHPQRRRRGAAAVICCAGSSTCTTRRRCGPRPARCSTSRSWPVPTPGGARRSSGPGASAAGAPAPGASSVHRVDLARPTALVFGNEAHGLADPVGRLLDATLRIPMAGQCESLNVASAAAVVCFEAARQRAGRAAGGAGRDEAATGPRRPAARRGHRARRRPPHHRRSTPPPAA